MVKEDYSSSITVTDYQWSERQSCTMFCFTSMPDNSLCMDVVVQANWHCFDAFLITYHIDDRVVAKEVIVRNHVARK